MIDLHLHTNMSDGLDTPDELVSAVESFGCTAFSVTDHDDIRANSIITALLSTNGCTAKFSTGVEI